ncbi:MAG: carbonic anhydrase [Bacteroidetes bacterium OLB11]|nr:MAG: carbonic anhydrase [Bacteroidetes bacterium OLB11]
MNIENEKEKFDRFVELNIKRQVLNLAATSIVQHAWSIGQDLTIHGWVYGIDTGLIKDLDVNFSSQEDIKNNPI